MDAIKRTVEQQLQAVLVGLGLGPLQKWRCRRCGRTLLEHSVTQGTVVKICQDNKCKAVNVLVDGIPQLPKGETSTCQRTIQATTIAGGS